MIKEIFKNLMITFFLLFVVAPLALWLVLWIGHYSRELMFFIFDQLPWPG